MRPRPPTRAVHSAIHLAACALAALAFIATSLSACKGLLDDACRTTEDCPRGLACVQGGCVPAQGRDPGVDEDAGPGGPDGGGAGADAGDVDDGGMDADGGAVDDAGPDAGDDEDADAGFVDAGPVDAGQFADAGPLPCGVCPDDTECVAAQCRSTSPYGAGEDGPAFIDASADLGAVTVVGSPRVDQGSARVDAIAGAIVNITRDASQFLALGDEVLLITLRGHRDTDGNAVVGAVGTYETFFVDDIADFAVRLHKAPERQYGDPAQDVIALYRIPHYESLEIAAGGKLFASPFQAPSPTGSAAIVGRLGGVIFLRVSGPVIIQAGGVLDASGAGFRGGPTGQVPDEDGRQGEGRAGYGPRGEGSAAGYNRASVARNNNRGGGGSPITGAGGGHGTDGQPGDAYSDAAINGFPIPPPPQAGVAYGQQALTSMFFGGGGGGVWHDSFEEANTCGDGPGPAGPGGGIVVVFAGEVFLDGPVVANGAETRASGTGANAYGAGGGAGGTIWLSTQTMELTAPVTAVGGPGWVPDTCGRPDEQVRAGGDGAVGRIRIDAVTINGVEATAADLELVVPAPYVD